MKTFQHDYDVLVKKAFGAKTPMPEPPKMEGFFGTAKDFINMPDNVGRLNYALQNRLQERSNAMFVATLLGGAGLGGLAGGGAGLLWRNREKDPKKRSLTKVALPAVLGAGLGGFGALTAIGSGAHKIITRKAANDTYQDLIDYVSKIPGGGAFLPKILEDQQNAPWNQ